jgi:uncharacterized membrane protein YkvA (DUF1232 family)
VWGSSKVVRRGCGERAFCVTLDGENAIRRGARVPAQSKTETDHIAALRSWVESFADDIETVKAVVDSEATSAGARKLAAGALSYLVTKMDLVPDWNDTLGILDDVMVLRVCLAAAGAEVDEGLPAKSSAAVGRLVNDADRVEQVLGDVYPRFKTYCARLADTSVRGRTPQQVVADEAARKALYDEIAEDLKRLPSASFSDSSEETVAKLRAYLHHKLPQ